MNPDIFVVKNNGKREPFDGGKLKTSLVKAGASIFVADDILKEITSTLKDGTTTYTIYKKAFSFLKRKEKSIALKYTLKRSIIDLGPTGFPFEQYVAEIFKAKGYQTLTGQIVQGFCTEHEIDVVAYTDDKLIMTEAKFHNQLGLKSDLKVALYVKARFDDLAKMQYTYGGKTRAMTEGILITNTKFSDRAIKYSACAGVNLIGWNYPYKGSLHDLIIETGLHPVTCLTTLTVAEKRLLIEENIVNCRRVAENKDLLKQMIGDETRIQKILDEVENVCGR